MSKITNKSENYKGSLLERADKEGWKVTVLKPQGKQDEQFIRDKFRDDFPGLFETPDKNIVAMGGDYDGFTGDWVNNEDGENMEEAIYEMMNIEEMLSELTPRQREIAELRLEGYSYKEIGEKLGISPRTVQEHIQSIRR